MGKCGARRGCSLGVGREDGASELCFGPGWCIHGAGCCLLINSTWLHVKDEAINAGGVASAQPCSDATGGFPARNLLFFLQPSDCRSPGHPAQDFAASSNAPIWKMPCPAPRAVLSLPEQGLFLPGQGCGMGTGMGTVPAGDS